MLPLRIIDSGIEDFEGRERRAARLWGASEALLEAIEVAAYPHAPDRSLREREVAAARSRLGKNEWEEAWAAGRAMAAGQAAAYAFEGA